jgi:hypothetical protein
MTDELKIVMELRQLKGDHLVCSVRERLLRELVKEIEANSTYGSPPR